MEFKDAVRRFRDLNNDKAGCVQFEYRMNYSTNAESIKCGLYTADYHGTGIWAYGDTWEEAFSELHRTMLEKDKERRLFNAAPPKDDDTIPF